jgi:phospholipase/carboxylesterase
MNRRGFLTLGAGAFGWLTAARSVHGQTPQSAQPPAPAPASDIPYGESRLGISNGLRDGTLFVPKSYKAGVPMPLLMMLHGYAGSGDSMRYTFPLAEEFGVIVIAPESRDLTWGQSAPGFDPDVRYLSAAVRAVVDMLDIDPTHVALGGISDGAGYALSMGLAYGDSFNHVMVFSGGLMIPFRRQGSPHIFIAHGINDIQMPIDRTGRRFANELKIDGYDVTYREYEGGHAVPRDVLREGFEWFLADLKRP